MTSNGTPPHYPTFGVRFTEDQIKTIVSLVFPGKHLAKFEQLPSGKSYNNRIYFLDVCTDSKPNSETEQYVLKVAGYYFGALKIQNEVGCLQLLAKYCPGVPTPKAVAWSNHGTVITTVDGRSLKPPDTEATALSDGEAFPPSKKFSWVLQTRLPGRLLDVKELDGPSGGKIIRSLAAIVAEWRTKLPEVAHYGNVRYREHSDTSRSTTIFSDQGQGLPDFAVGGLILCSRYSKAALQSAADFYTYYAEDNLRDLNDRQHLKPLAKKIEEPVRAFVKEDLPRLPIFRDRQDTAKFTHFDFAPRNILVSDTDPSSILGILDCEFAGFAPWEEEYVNMQVRQNTDWPEKHYRSLVEEIEKLEQKDQPNPGGHVDSTSSEHLAQVCLLAKFIANVRPWYIMEGSHSEEELEKEFDQASSVVFDCIEQLRATL